MRRLSERNGRLAALAVAIAAVNGVALTNAIAGTSSRGATCLRLVPAAYGPTVWNAISAPNKPPADVIANWGGTTKTIRARAAVPGDRSATLPSMTSWPRNGMA